MAKVVSRNVCVCFEEKKAFMMILDDKSTSTTFTDDTNAVNVEYLINKELRIINTWLKLHTLS